MDVVAHRGGVIRVAERTDARGMAEVHVRAWQVGYEGQMPADHLESLDVDEFAARWASSFAVAPERRPAVALVAETVDGDIAGIASFGDARDEPGSGELWMLNVHPDHWRDGWGAALLSTVFDELEQVGHRSSILWVVETNVRGRSFYEAQGWHADGGMKTESIGSAQITECRYRRFHSEVPG